MKRTKIFLFVLIATFVFGAAHTKAKEEAPVTEPSVIADDNNSFVFDLYSTLSKKEKGNIFFSPYSVSTALAMVYAGARGETATQMEKALHFTLGQEKLHPEFAKIMEGINKRSASGSCELAIANRLWGQKGYKIQKSFEGLTSKYYDAKMELVDFSDAESARQTINKWIEKKTKDKIKDILPSGSIAASTKLILTNAIYFKGKWEKPFKKTDTKDDSFLLADGKEIKVPTMRMVSSFKYGELPDKKILEMTYKGEDISMVVLLPDKVDGIFELERGLTSGKVKEWLAQTKRERTNVHLPRFTFTFGTTLNDDLGSLGMPVAFTDAADFSGIDDKDKLKISAVIHKAFIDVNEEGTEAAAATGVGLRATGIDQPNFFMVNHPFIFLIRDIKTGSILFIGRVMDPRN